MVLPEPGNTLVFTGTISPEGAAFPEGTTFTAVSADPQVSVSVSGLVVTAVIGNSPAGTDATITWESSVFTPEPATSPNQIKKVIPLTIVAAPVSTPTDVEFAQTT